MRGTIRVQRSEGKAADARGLQGSSRRRHLPVPLRQRRSFNPALFAALAMLLLGGLFASGAQAQGGALQVTDLTDPNVAPIDLAQSLVGSGITVVSSSVAFTGDHRAGGILSGGTGILGFEEGIVLGSGRVLDIVGPNNAVGTFTSFGTPGDAALQSIAGATTFDAAILEFDFHVPSGTTSIHFEYVFGSEEYNEYVESGFNDAFAFFVNGSNCALTPDNQPVTINTINNGRPGEPATNPQLYVNNDPVNPDQDGTVPSGDLLNTEMDGLTVVLGCTAAVNAGTNSLRIAIADGGDSSYDSWVVIRKESLTVTEPPSAPRSLTAAPGPGPGMITIDWNPPESDGGAPVTSYAIYSGTSSGSLSLLTTVSASQTEFQHSGLPNAHTRHYGVKAINSVGEGPMSNLASAATFNVPSAPQNLDAAAGPNPGEISLSWSPPATNGGLSLTSYRIYAGTSSGSLSLLTTVGPGQLSYVHGGLPSDATRFYNVRATNAAGEGPASNVDSATTFNRPSAPQNLDASTGPGAGAISLSWNPPASNGGTALTSYRIYAGPSPGSISFLTSVGPSQTSHVHSGLGPGVIRHYEVRAVNQVGEGPASNQDSAMTFNMPSAPLNLVATTGPGAGAISLDWDPPGSDGGKPLTGYRIYTGPSSGSLSVLTTVGPSQTSFVHSGLASGVTKHYKVTALNEIGESPASNGASASTFPPPGAPQNPQASAGPGAGEISLSWDAPGSAGGLPLTSYRVYAGPGWSSLGLLASVPATQETFLHSGLANDATWFYEIRAVTDAGEGSGALASATTFGLPGAPQAPVAAAGPGAGAITFEWDPPGSDGGMPLVAYKVYSGATSGGLTLLETVEGSQTSLVHNGLGSAVTRFYAVAAVTDAGEGAKSGEVSATTFDVPSAPSGLAVTTGPGAGELSLDWDPPASDGGMPITSYKLYSGASSGQLTLLTTLAASQTGFLHAGLGNDVTRFYAVAAVTDAGEGAKSAEVSATTFDVAGAPQNVAASSGPGAAELTVTWSAPTTDGGMPVSGYKVYAGPSSGSLTEIATLGASQTSHVETGLGNDVTRYYQVTAVTDAGEGAASPTVSATTFGVPGAPQNVAASAGPGAGTITLGWNAPSTDGGMPLTGYNIYAGTLSGSLSLLATVAASETQFLHQGLGNDATRHYRVAAVTQAGEGALSPEVSATSFDVPGAPQNVAAATGPGAGEITLTWAAPTSDGGLDLTNYRVYAGTTSGTLSLLDTVHSTQTSLEHTGLGNSAAWYYQVAAVTEAGEGPRSVEASAVTFDLPSAPQGPTAAAGPGAETISLSWSAPTDDGGLAVHTYNVYGGGVSGDLVLLGSLPAAETSFVETGLGNDATRFYQVAAVTDAGEGAVTAEVSATTFDVPTAPLDAGAVAGPGAGEITLSWSAPSHDGGLPVTAYRVYGGPAADALALIASLPASQTSLLDGALGNDVTRFYQVAAVTEAGEGAMSAVVSATTFDVPTAPVDPNAAAGPGAGEITFSWQAPSSDGGMPVTGYNVYAGPTSGSLALVENLPASQTTLVEDSLGTDTTRFYRVTAVSDAGEGALSVAVSATTFDVPAAPEQSSAVPGPGAGEITLDWEPPAEDGGMPVTSYIVYAGSTSTTLSELQSLGPAQTSFVHTGLGNAESRFYQVSAVSDAGEGAVGALVSATTFDVPSAPVDPSAAAGPGAGVITFSWHVPSTDGGLPLTGYNVYAGATAGALSLLETVPASQTSILDGLLGTDATRYYRVAAMSDAGEGAFSVTVSATTFDVPDAPEQLNAAAGAGAGEITLDWEPPADDGGLPVTSYIAYAGTTSGSLSVLQSLDASQTTLVHAGLDNALTVFYQVSAVTDAGEGALTAEVSATTFGLAGAPEEPVAAPGPGAGEITIGWQAPADDGGLPVTAYNVYSGPTSGDLDLHSTVGAAQMGLLDTGLENAEVRFYGVAAVTDAGEGVLSAVVSAATFDVPGVPLGLVAAPGPGAGTITIDWSVPANDGGTPFTGFRVYGGANSGELALLAILDADALNHTQSGLENDATHFFAVSAENIAGEGALSDTASATTFNVPDVPQALTAVAGPDPGQIHLEWAAPATDGGLPVMAYDVYARAPDGEFTVIASLAAEESSYLHVGLPNGATRIYAISATNEAGEGAQSATASATTFDVPTPPLGPAAVPGPGPGTLSVSWSAPGSDGGTPITGYRLFGGSASDTLEPLAVLSADQTEFVESGLPNDATRFYHVTALNAAGEGAPSALVSATTFDVPAPPVGLEAATGPGAGAILLEWQAPGHDGGLEVLQYHLYRGESSDALDLIATLGPSASSYQDTGLPNAATRHYRVSAENAAGEGAGSVLASATTFDVPLSPQALDVVPGPGPSTLSLSWNAPASDGGLPVLEYRVYRGETSGDAQLLASVPASQSGFTDTGLGNAVTRHYRVSAVNEAGEGALGDEVSATTFDVPDAPEAVAAAPGPGPGALTVEWEAPLHDGGLPVTRYEVFMSDSVDGPFASIGETSRFARSFSHKIFLNNETRHFEVRAVNDAGPGALSARVSATTFDVPTPPLGLDAVAGEGPGSITLSWQTSASDGGTSITAYRVYAGTPGSGLSLLTTLSGAATGYVHEGLGNAATWEYQVTAVNEVGEGAPSATASATTFALPDAPSDFAVVVGPGAGELALSWAAPPSDGGLPLIEYVIYAGGSAGALEELATVPAGVLAYQDSGLGNGVTRFYQVSARNDAGEGAASLEASATTFDLPAAPLAVDASAGPRPGAITFDWSAPATDGGSPISGFNVYAGDPGENMTFFATVDAATFSLQENGLGDSTTRHYQVAAVNIAGEGPWSSAAVATTFGVPSAPLDITAIAGPGVGEITLGWSAPLQDGGLAVTQYEVLAAHDQDPFAPLVTVNGTTFSHLHASPENGSTWHYSVRALNDAGTGPLGAPAQATVFDLPGIPQGLNATAGPMPGEISLTWQAPLTEGGTPVTGYVLYGANGTGGPYDLIATTTDTAFVETSLAEGHTRFYAVAARNMVGEGALAAETTATAFDRPGVPLDLSATTGPGVGEINVTWSPPASDGGTPLTGFTLYASDAMDGPFVPLASTDTLGFKETGLPAGTARFYAVSAMNLVGEGNETSVVNATTYAVPEAPLALNATAGPGVGEVSLVWAPPLHTDLPIVAYQIYRATTAGGPYVALTNVTGTQLAHVDGGLPNGTTFQYHVSAVSAAGEGPNGTAANATVFDFASAPVNATASAGPASGEVTLQWEPSEDDGGTPVTGYAVYGRNATTGPFALLAMTGPDNGTFSEGGLVGGQWREYFVRPLNMVGEGAATETFLVQVLTVPGAPPFLQANSGPGAGQVQLQWYHPSEGGMPVDEYRIYRGTDAAAMTLHVTVAGTSTQYVDQVFGPSTLDPTSLAGPYYYQVVAANVIGPGPGSEVACAAPAPSSSLQGALVPACEHED